MQKNRGNEDMQVVLADNHKDVRSALRLLLGEKPDILIAGEASSAGQLLDQIKAGQADLVILEWELPDSQPRNLLRRLFTIKPDLMVIVLSSRPQFRQSALDWGAREFVCKSEPPEYLLAALERCQKEYGSHS
jgi:DNA-binding NarL/FixJ family response regulator